MTRIKKEFGFFPGRLDIDIGAVSIRTLTDFEESVEGVRSREEVDEGWIYARAQQRYELHSGEVRDLPYSARLFSLPKTHRLEHRSATDEEHVAFHLWVLSFFLGLRLSWTEAGFLDATPVKGGTLVDFSLSGGSIGQVIELAEAFWLANRSNPRDMRRFAAAVNALFLSQYPQSLQFERFFYLYIATDACYRLTKSLCNSTQASSHSSRIGWMCSEFAIQTPTWARVTDEGVGGTELATLRNDALHEALYAGEPLGFSLHGAAEDENLTREMRALVCRLLVALIGVQGCSYLASNVNTRQRVGLTLP